MHFNPLRTIQGKFTLYLSTFVIVIMSGLSFWTISREKKLMENGIIREGIALVESLAISCTNTMLYEEVGLVDESGLLDNYISDLMKKNDLDIRYAMILNPQGEVIAHGSRAEVGNIYRDSVTQRALSAKDTLRQYPSPDLLDIATPLAIASKRWGTLRIGISLEYLRNEISLLVWRYVLFTALFIIAAIAINGILFGLITKPLKSLAEEMDSMRFQEDVSGLSVNRRDEIAIIQQSFYRMVKNLKADEEERERTRKNLFFTEKMVAIGKLTAGLAHEINNPLGGILNCIYHFKKRGQSTEQRQEYLDLMEEGVRRIQRRVTNLLEYARNPSLERSATDFRALMTRTLALLDYQIKKNRISVEEEIAEALPLVEIDKDQMGQVLLNILLNAVQAMPDGGVLRVNALVAAERLVVTVSDTGEGIPAEILSKVFDPFFTTKKEGQGTGLGLWLSQKIIEQHGGTIHVTSREKQGATVEIIIPLSSKGVL